MLQLNYLTEKTEGRREKVGGPQKVRSDLRVHEYPSTNMLQWAGAGTEKDIRDCLPTRQKQSDQSASSPPLSAHLRA